MMPTGGQQPHFLNPSIAMVTSMPVSTSHMFNQQPAQTIGGVRPIVTSSYTTKQEPMQLSPDIRLSKNLYLCNSGNADSKIKTSEDSKEKASVDVLDTEYNSLIQTNIKDSLSSFVPDIPGEFDTSDTPESMLRTLIDRPPIGGREFLPLSDQSLLGFRLHPGPLPEQYRLDPPLSESPRHHKKKKKHKHKHVDKTEESSLVNYTPPISREHSPPVDPCDFIKSEQTVNFFHQPPQHTSHSHLLHAYTPQMQHHTATILHPSIPGGVFVAGNLIPSAGVFTSAPQSVIVDGGNKLTAFAMTTGNPALLTADAMRIPKPKKKRHENGEGPPKKKKKKDKDKKKKREKHHLSDQPPPPPPPAPPSSSSSSICPPL